VVKEQLRAWLADERYEPLVELAGRKKRVLSWLMALTYDRDPLIGWHAVEAIGLAASRVAAADPEFVRNYLRRLLWLLNDESGGIGWHAPQAIGEILRNRPRDFAEFVPLLISLLDMEEEDAVRFRPGILWAIGRLGPALPDAVDPSIPLIVACLHDANAQTRGLAAWCLGQLGAIQNVPRLESLLKDESPVDLYVGGQIVRTSVARLVGEALQSGAGSSGADEQRIRDQADDNQQ
jgi:hypothetical protein